MNKVELQIQGPIASITLSNPEKQNAFDDTIIKQLRSSIAKVASYENARVLILRAEGKNFSAGADLSWMKSMATHSYEDNLADAADLAALMQELYDLQIPTIARVQGAAFGGAIGLISCCDIAVAAENAKFCLSEVKLGLAPATIGPFVVKAVGARIAKKLFLTAELFSAQEAKEYNLIHEIVDKESLDSCINKNIQLILGTGPIASKAAKQLVKTIDQQKDNINQYTSELIAKLRTSEEGQHGLTSFFEKNQPRWTKNLDDGKS